MFENKKGISPLIATLMLIVFSIALGAIVMTWGRTYVEGASQVAQQTTESSVSCDFDASIGIRKVADAPRICHSGTDVQALVENTGIIEVKGLSVQIIGDKISKTDFPNVELQRSDVQILTIPYSGIPAQVQITPNYYSNGKQVCPKNILVVENIKKC